MKQLKPTAAVMLDDRRKKTDGTYPLKLRITFNSTRYYYSVGYDVTETEWQKFQEGNYRGGYYKQLEDFVSRVVEEANSVFRDLELRDIPFSKAQFEAAYFDPHPSKNDVFEAFKAYSTTLKDMGKISSSDSYTSALKSLEDFTPKKTLQFDEVTPDFLRRYYKWMNGKGKSDSTVGIYLRNLRTLFNQAINSGKIPRELYPFGRGRFVIPVSEERDLALSTETLKALYEYSAGNDQSKARAKDLWFFIYLCNGMNVKDLCRLKYKNIGDDSIVFYRAKTTSTMKRTKPVIVPISDEIRGIIRKWGNPTQNQEDYVFPFFEQGITPKRERAISLNVSGVINDGMNRIAKDLEIPDHITTYSARHTHSNVMMEMGAPMKMISDNLGHASSQITERHYLGQYGVGEKKKFTDRLLNFEIVK
jgi:integrase/recombinase XerD